MRVTLGGREDGEKAREELALIGMEKSVPDSGSISCSISNPAIFSRMVRSTRGGFDVKRERTWFRVVGRREYWNRWSPK